MRQKVRSEEQRGARNNIRGEEDSIEQTAKLSRDDIEMLQQNRELAGAVRVGRGAEGSAADTRVNLQHQSDQAYRLNQQVLEMGKRDIGHS